MAGLDNVDNAADKNRSASTSTRSALNLKVDAAIATTALASSTPYKLLIADARSCLARTD